MSPTIDFFKYQATGNDFIILDNRSEKYDPNHNNLWKKMCQRATGVGADGVLFVENSEKYDFKMVYLNSDGSKASMCGNGARAISSFYAETSNKSNLKFETEAGIYSSEVESLEMVKLNAPPIKDINLYHFNFPEISNSCFVNSGVPHAVFEIQDIENYDLESFAPKVRYDLKIPNGTNVNIIERKSADTFAIRTYERGVEGETLSCGTGVIASAYLFAKTYNQIKKVKAQTKGGNLVVEFDNNWQDIALWGPVNKVFFGKYFYE